VDDAQTKLHYSNYDDVLLQNIVVLNELHVQSESKNPPRFFDMVEKF